MNYDAAQFWFNVVLALGTIAVSLYVWIMRRQMATQKDVEHVAMAVARLETAATHQPSHEDMGKVYTKINEVADRVASNEGTLKSINSQVGQVMQHLLKEGSK